MSTIDLTPVFQAIIALLAALVTYRLIPWIQSKTNKNQQEALITAARIAVLAAEQVFGSGRGKEKFNYALAALKAAGFNIDGSIAIAAIEKAVRDLNLFKDIPDEPDGQEEPVEVVDPLDTDGVKLDGILYSDDKPIIKVTTSPAVVGSDNATTASSPTVTAENTATNPAHADAAAQTITHAPEAHPPEPSENE